MQNAVPDQIADMKRTLRQIAGLSESDARGLPGAFYASPEFFQYETETFLKRAWHCLGRADEIPETGDYFTTRLLDEPLLVVRGEERSMAVPYVHSVRVERGELLEARLDTGERRLDVEPAEREVAGPQAATCLEWPEQSGVAAQATCRLDQPPVGRCDPARDECEAPRRTSGVERAGAADACHENPSTRVTGLCVPHR